jgi:hypothetical protein
LSNESSPPRKAFPSVIWELLAAGLILAWRFRLHPLPFLCRDWITILCVFWIAAALGGRSRAWPYVMGGVMTALLVLYSAGQFPQTLGALGSLR